jgi:CBS domain-containing protein
MRNSFEETAQRTEPARAVAAELTVSDLLRLFVLDQRSAYPVIRDGEMVGSVSKADVLKTFSPCLRAPALDYDSIMGTTVDRIMSRDVIATGTKRHHRQQASPPVAPAAESYAIA